MSSYELVKEFHVKNGHAAPGGYQEPTPGLALLRTRLILEEHGELAVAFHELNLLEAADGLTDLYYVSVGTAVSVGLPSAVVEPREPRGKLEHFQKVDARLLVLFSLTRGAKAVVEELSKPRPDPRDLHWALHTLIAEIVAASDLFGLPLQELLGEVHRSNMSKNVTGRSGDSKYGTADPKGPGYTPPDLQSIISRCQTVTE